MNLINIRGSLRPLGLVVALPFGCGFQSVVATYEPDQSTPQIMSSVRPIEQAWIDIQCDDAVIQASTADFLIEKGDANPISNPAPVRAELDQTIKRVIDLSKSQTHLTSEQPATRRSAATDPGQSTLKGVPAILSAYATVSLGDLPLFFQDFPDRVMPSVVRYQISQHWKNALHSIQ